MKIAVVIVNYCTPVLAVDCLASLASEAESMLDIRAFVGDAASGDGSGEIIREAIKTHGWSDWALCYDIGTNGGFAFANNHIVTHSVLPDPSFEYVHFLNPDTYIHPGAVRVLARFLAAHPNAGAAGSRLENPDGTPRAYGFREPAPWREFFRGARLGLFNRLVPSATVTITGLDETWPVDWVSGASFMVPRKVINTIGLMDSEFFLYFEETEFMARIRDAGWTVWHISDSRVVHLAGQATGVRADSGQPAPLSPHWLASRRRYYRLRYGRFGGALANAAYLMGDLVYRTHQLVRFRRPKNPPRLWASYLSLRQGRQ